MAASSASSAPAAGALQVLMIGTGEYTTGFGANSAKTDKGAGVVALTLFDLRSRGFVGKLHLAGTSGGKFPAIREHMTKAIGETYAASGYDLSVDTYPADGAVDPHAYRTALAALPKGSAVTIFTPVGSLRR
jgi:D-galacturonate reductase